MKKGRRDYHSSFVKLDRKTIFGEEWKKLSPRAKVLYIMLKARFNGSNNGEITLPYSAFAGVAGFGGHPTISRTFQELEEQEWISRKKIGGLYRYSKKIQLTGKHDEIHGRYK